MKWVGQYIQNLVSRFRSDVYLEDISDHGSDPDRFLSADSTTGKVTYRTGAEVLSDGGGVDINKTIGSVSIIPDSASSYASWVGLTGGNAALIRLVGGEGIDTTANDQINGTWPTVTISGEDASDSNKGVVELATTVEADTGTDTARAITAAGLRSHVSSRFTYQYITFSFKAANIPPDAWMTPSQNGPEFYLWANTHGDGETQGASDPPATVDEETTISVDYLDQPSGFIIPLGSKLDGFYGNCRVNGTNPNTLRPVLGLFRAAEPADGNTADVTATCVAFDKYDTASGNRKNRFLKLETSGENITLARGDLLFPAVGFDASASDSAGDIWGSFTIVLKTLIPS